MEHAGWPKLSLAEWEDTYKTLHRFCQVLGKMRLALSPWQNHWWHVALYVNERGLTTSPMPYHGELMTLTLDLQTHRLIAERSDRSSQSFAFDELSVAEFFDRTRHILGCQVKIWRCPVEVADKTAFDKLTQRIAYNHSAVQRLHRILLSTEQVFQQYRGAYLGKSSPVHFFWGGFDLAVTRFSGRRNPTPPPDKVMGEGYSHEVISHGLWFGGDWPLGGRVDEAVFYSYAVPEPKGFAEAKVVPAEAKYAKQFNEFFLPYEAVRTARDPAATLRSFMDSTFAAGAKLGSWPIDNTEP